MTPYQNQTSKICIRMSQDMKIRNFASSTIDSYTYQVDKFEQFLGDKPISQARLEDIRDFQLHLIEVRKVGFSSFNQAVCGLKFLYSVTLPRDWPVVMIPFGKRAKTLPTVLSDCFKTCFGSSIVSLNTPTALNNLAQGCFGYLRDEICHSPFVNCQFSLRTARK